MIPLSKFLSEAVVISNNGRITKVETTVDEFMTWFSGTKVWHTSLDGMDDWQVNDKFVSRSDIKKLLITLYENRNETIVIDCIATDNTSTQDQNHVIFYLGDRKIETDTFENFADMIKQYGTVAKYLNSL